MLNPFDDSVADQFSRSRFSDGVAAEAADARETMDAALAASSEVTAAKRAEKYRKARQKEAWAREDKLLRRQRSLQSSAQRSSLVGAGIGAVGAIGGGIIAAV
jgi:hypothetical protein